MDLIIILVIIWFVYKAIQKQKASKQIVDAAKHSACTNDIIKTLRILSEAKVDRVDCVLSIKKISRYYGMKSSGEITGELIDLKVIFTSDKLAQVLKANQQSMSETLRKIDVLKRIGNYNDSLKLHEEIPLKREHAAKSFEMFFGTKPDHSLMATFALNNECSILGNQSIGHTGYIVSDLGVPYSKYGAPRSPYVLDAVEEAAQNIPHISLNIVKTIPSGNS